LPWAARMASPSSSLMCGSNMCSTEDLGCGELQQPNWREETDVNSSTLEEARALTTNKEQPEKLTGLKGQPEQASSCCWCLSCVCCLVAALLLLLLVVVEAAVAVQVASPLVGKRQSWREGLVFCGGAEVEAQASSNSSVACNSLAPPNLTDALAFPEGCLATPLQDNPLVIDMALLNQGLEWKMVNLSSRESRDGQEAVQLTAWWLPVADARAPRIVVLHGEDSNFNDWTVQVMAYLLRSMGFAALVPNFRDHGSSGTSPSAGVAWGWDYYLDVLGAWDYAVNDPHGQLGSKVDASNVGVVGMSMGGFAAMIALGLEPFIPAVWVDSAPFDLRNELRRRISSLIGSWLPGATAPLAAYLAPLFMEVSWRYAGHSAGADLGHMSPREAIREAGTPRRPIAIVHGLFDDIVPRRESEELLKAADSYPESLQAKEVYFPPSACGDTVHQVAHIWAPNSYRHKLCTFWSGVFGTDSSACAAGSLPDLEGNTTTTTLTSTSTRSTTTTSTTIGVERHSPLWDLLHSTTTSTTTSFTKTQTSTTSTTETRTTTETTTSTTTFTTSTFTTTETHTATSTSSKTLTATHTTATTSTATTSTATTSTGTTTSTTKTTSTEKVSD